MKILQIGVAVLDDDTHVSKWVEEHGTLKIAETMLAPFQRYVLPGSTVIDAGAMIGDHSATYAEWVGPYGLVYAFEPNPAAYGCLLHNMKDTSQVRCFHLGLSDSPGRATLNADSNAGASYLSMTGDDIQVIDLDSMRLEKVAFIKVDVEGFETRLISGAKGTISANRPVILVEVNRGALERAGTSVPELLNLVSSLNYVIRITDFNLAFTDPQYDVICIPRERVDVC